MKPQFYHFVWSNLLTTQEKEKLENIDVQENIYATVVNENSSLSSPETVVDLLYMFVGNYLILDCINYNSANSRIFSINPRNKIDYLYNIFIFLRSSISDISQNLLINALLKKTFFKVKDSYYNYFEINISNVVNPIILEVSQPNV